MNTLVSCRGWEEGKLESRLTPRPWAIGGRKRSSAPDGPPAPLSPHLPLAEAAPPLPTPSQGPSCRVLFGDPTLVLPFSLYPPDVFFAGLWVQMMGILGGNSAGAIRRPQKGLSCLAVSCRH